MPIDDGRVKIIALAGLPEVAPGDDLEAMIGDALEATPGVLPLQAGDVLVVTQKIVSKAEGAVVDLRTITPSAEAIESGPGLGPRPAPGPGRAATRRAASCARRTGCSSSRRTTGSCARTRGVDASNVGPGVRRPRDPPAARPRRLRRAHPGRARRPVRHRRRRHRLGQLRAARGAGASWTWRSASRASMPLEDLRGTPDADGRVMQSTVRGVADEIASAAELALGKSAGRPVALVPRRAAAHRRGLDRATS